MNRYMEDNLPRGSFYSLVQDKILVDEFKPKFGDEKDFAVFSFLVKQRDVANKLMSYIVQKNFDLLDVGVSPNPKLDLKSDPNKDWKYIFFIEMSRNKDMFAVMDKLLLHIDHLVSIKQWYFKTSAYKEYMDWDRANFVKVIPQTADEHSNKEPIPGGPDEPDEIDNVPQNSKDADTNHRFLEEVIARQEAKFNQSYIKTLKEQIKTINENKLQMARYIEDLKIDREHLYKQLELSCDREKMALLREQQDFKRIESLENQLALLPAPGSREMKIFNPNRNSYDTDVKPVIGIVATEAKVKDEEEKIDKTDIEKTYRVTEPFVPAEDEEESEPEQEIVDDIEDTMWIELDALNEAIDSTEDTAPGVIEDAVSKGDDEKIDQKKDDARKYTSLGVEAAGQKDYHKAIAHFSKAVEILPDNAAGFCNLAILHYRLKEYETAYGDAQKAIYLGSPSATQILEKIKLVMVADLKSTEGFEPAVKIGKNKSSLVAGKDEGETFFIDSDTVTLDEFIKTEKQNQSDSAVDASLREKDAVANDNFNLGLAAVEKKEFSKAIEHFNKVVGLLPNGIPSYIHLTKIHYYLGEHPQAIKYAKKAIALGDYTIKPILEKLNAKLAKESAPFSSTKPMELKEQETPAEAVEGTEEEPEELESHADAEPDKKAMEDEPAPEVTVKMPDVEFVEPVALVKAADSRENTTPVSIEPASIEKAVSKDESKKIDQEDNARKYMALGVKAASQKDYHKAIEHFTKAVEILPDNAVGFFNLAMFHYHLENYNTARKHAEKALSLGLNSAQSLLEKIKSKIATVSKAPPAKDEIEYRTLPPVTSLQKESMQVPPKSDSVNDYFKLGLAASDRNDFTAALEYFNKVATALPKVPYSFLNMADLHYRMKNYKTARKHAERALELGSYAAHRILSKIEDSLN